MVRKFTAQLDCRGQALVEFALIMPILLLLLFGLFAVGYSVAAAQIVTVATRQGARQGALTNNNDQIISAILANMQPIDPLMKQTKITILPADASDAGRLRGNPLTVEVSYTVPFAFSFMPDGFRVVSSRVVVMMECDPIYGQTTCL